MYMVSSKHAHWLLNMRKLLLLSYDCKTQKFTSIIVILYINLPYMHF